MPELLVHPISPTIGAEIAVEDLRALSATAIERLKDAVFQHQVVFIRDQELSEADLIRIAAWFGEAVDQSHGGLLGTLSYVSTYAITPEHGPRADNWHTDLSFWEVPPAVACLYNVAAPEAGGDTVWASSYAAFDALSPPFRSLCSGLRARHSPGEGLARYAIERGNEELARRIAEEYPPREQPLVIRHPSTGRSALFVGSFLDHIVGVEPEESTALLQVLRAHYDNPNFQVRFRWRPGSLAIFDERATNHRGLSDHWPSHPYRTMRSIFVSDGVPVADLAARADEPALT